MVQESLRDDESGPYADRVVFRVDTIESPMEPAPIDRYQIDFNPGGSIDLGWLRAEVENINSFPSSGDGFRVQSRNYILRERRTHFSWGADATQVEFYMQIGESVAQIGGVLAVEHALEELVAKLRDRFGNVRFGPVVDDMSDAEIEAQAINLVELNYSVPAYEQTLVETGSNEQENTYSGITRGADGTTYGVTFSIRGGEAMLVAKFRRPASSRS